MASIRTRTRTSPPDPRTGKPRPPRYEVRWFDPDTRDRLSQGGFRTRRDALTFAREVDAALTTGTYLDPRRGEITLADHAEHWIEAHPGKRRTVAGYRTYLRTHITTDLHIPADDTRPARTLNIGTTYLADLRPSTIRLWLRGIAARTGPGGQPLAPATVAQARRTLHACLQAAVDDGLIPTNPATRAKLPAHGRAPQERRHLTHHQYQQLLAATPAEYRIAVVLMGSCGLRWGEMAGLRLGRIDRDERLLHVVETVSEVGGKLAADTPKSAAGSRAIPLPNAAYTALLAHLAIRFCGPDDYLLHTASGAPLGYRWYRRSIWDPAIADAGLDSAITPHCLRHSYATWLLDSGVAVQTVRKLLGHASLATTQIYSHSNRDQDRLAIAKLESAMTA